MRILFAASEALPYAKTGGLADVVEALPRALVKLGHEVAVFLPLYRGVKSASVVMPSMTIPQGTRLRFPAIKNGSVLRGVRYFFLDDPFYFDRDGIYGEKTREFPDNAERFTEFPAPRSNCQAHLRPTFYCNDWQT
jgi:starch synthase